MKILENKFFNFLIFVLMIAVIGYFVVSIDEKSRTAETKTIVVAGTGEVYASPDVGVINISVQTEDMDVSKASSDNSEKMNAIVSFLKGEGIEEKDIKTTGFNISPRYEYNYKTGERTLAGYEVTQTVNVKIRDLTKIGTVISESTSLGANDISSLSFIIDDDDAVKEQAKELAIKDAKEKAKNLEKALGIKLVRIVGFYESSSPAYDSYYYGLGAGESMKTASSVAVPTIETGQNKVTSNVSITYAVR